MKKLLVFLLILLGVNSTDSFATLKLTCPKGGEKFVAGSDTLITWEGIAPSDSVQIEYSTNNGKTWLLVSKKSYGNNFSWKNIPTKIGAGYSMRLIHKGEINKLNEPYIEWQKTYGGTNWDELFDIQELDEGGYLAVGYSNSNNIDLPINVGEYDIWLLKTDPVGNIIFSKTFGGSKTDYPKFVKQTNDGGFIMGVCSWSEDYDFEAINSESGQILLKYDSKGNLQWEIAYGVIQSVSEGFTDLQETNDGGFIIIGDTNLIHHCDSIGKIQSNHLLILKLNKNGSYEWSKHYGGNRGSIASGIEITNDNGYIISASTSSDCGDVTNNYGLSDIWVLKLDEFGNLKWQNTYGGSLFDFSYSVKESQNGEIFVLGTQNVGQKGFVEDISVLKLKNNGELIWSKTYGGTLQDGTFQSPINPTYDSGFVFVGTTYSSNGDVTENKGRGDGWFVKIDKDGNIKYQSTFGGSYYDGFNSVQQTKDKGYIICGQTYSSDGDITENKGGYDGWIIKLGVNYPTIDTVMTTFSIVAPEPVALDVDMGKLFVGEWRDSTVADFVSNIGSYKFRVDSIYIRGADKTSFVLIDEFQKFNLEPSQAKEAKFKFVPTRVGLLTAEIVINTQSKTLVRKITGEGLKQRAKIDASAKPFIDLICENSTSANAVINNTGGAILIIKELNITGPDKADFSINETLPMNLAPDSSKTIAIGFKSNVPGIKTAALEIKSNADPDSVLTIPLTARKDSIALVPTPTLIDLGTLFPNQTKDSSFIISNLGTIQTDGNVTFTSNISCANPAFIVDSGGVYKLDFAFTGLPTDANINGKITVWDELCKYSRDVLITGKVVSPYLLGFSAVQCKSYSNEYKLTLQNPSSNRLKITSIEMEQNPQLFEIDPSLVFPLVIESYTNNYEVKVKYQDNIAQKFTTAVKCFTDNEFIPVLTDTIYAETVEYIRTTSGLINDTIRTVSNPFAVSYDSASENGKNKFTYSIQVNEIANDMEYLTGLSDLEVIINYNTNVLGVDFDTQSKNVKVRLGDELQGGYSIKSIKEIKINKFNSEIIINLENIGKQIISKNAYKILEMDFSAYLSNYNLTDEQNTEKSRKAIISHSITTPDECISYETADNTYLDIEKLCVDEFRSIKIPNNPDERFYLSDVIPHPIGTEGATIEYGLGFECEVTITIYDISGAVVLSPINEIQKAGTHKLAISSKSLSAGAYFIEMNAGPFKETKRVIVE